MFAMLAGLSADEKKSAEITSGTFDDLLMRKMREQFIAL